MTDAPFIVEPPFEPLDPWWISYAFADNICYLTDNTVVAFFWDGVTGADLRALVMVTDGQRIVTVGPSVYVDQVGGSITGTVPIAANKIDDTHLAVSYSTVVPRGQDALTGNDGYGVATCLLRVAGTQLTAGTPVINDSVPSTFRYTKQEAGQYIAVQGTTGLTVVGSFYGGASYSGGYAYQAIYQMAIDLPSLTITSSVAYSIPGDGAFYGIPEIIGFDGRYAFVSWEVQSSNNGNAVWDSVTQTLGPEVKDTYLNPYVYWGLGKLADNSVLVMSTSAITTDRNIYARVVSRNGTNLVLGAAVSTGIDASNYQNIVVLSPTLAIIPVKSSVYVGGAVVRIYTYSFVPLTVSGLTVTVGSPQILTEIANAVEPSGQNYFPYVFSKLNNSALIGAEQSSGDHGYQIFHKPVAPLTAATGPARLYRQS